MHHAFLYIPLPSLRDYDVKIPNFTFCGGGEHKATTFFSLFWTSIQFLLEFNSRKNCQHLTNWTRWNRRDKVWGGATSLFYKRRFHSRRGRCCLSSLYNDRDGYEKKWIRATSNFIALIPTRSIRHGRQIFLELKSTRSKLRKRKRKSLSWVHVLDTTWN